MDANLDPLLDEWPFEPGKLNVRMIRTDDGDQRLQIRLDLGILQMHVDGRPDGTRPDGFDSLLELFESRVDANVVRDGGSDAPPPHTHHHDPHHDEDPGENPLAGPTPADDPDPEHAIEPDDNDALNDRGDGGDEADANASPGSPLTTFTADECQAIRDEAVQYYHRYLSLLALEEYERVIRDTTRNLRAADLVRKHAQSPEDRASMEPFRPSITMMRARAMASLAMRDNETKAALHALDEGLEALRLHYEQHGEPEQFEASTEVQMLRSMREALIPKLPVSQKAELTERLNQALEQENYRLAAILRDELKLIERQSKPAE